MADIVATETYESFKASMIKHGACPESFMFVLMKTIAFMADCTAFARCEHDQEASDKLREEFFEKLPANIAHLIKEADDFVASQGKRKQ